MALDLFKNAFDSVLFLIQEFGHSAVRHFFLSIGTVWAGTTGDA